MDQLDKARVEMASAIAALEDASEACLPGQEPRSNTQQIQAAISKTRDAMMLVEAALLRAEDLSRGLQTDDG